MNSVQNLFFVMLPATILCLATAFSLCFPPFVQAIYPDMIWLFLYVFGVYAPSLIPLSILFILCLGMDILGGTVLGVHPAVMLVFWGIIQVQRRFLYVRSFISLWGIFVLLTFLGVGLNLGISAIMTPDTPLSLFRFFQVFMRFLTTVFMFPAVFYLKMTILKKIA